MRRASSLVSPTMEQSRDLILGKQGSPISIGCEWASAMSGPQGLQVSGEDHGAINTEQGIPLPFPSERYQRERKQTHL